MTDPTYGDVAKAIEDAADAVDGSNSGGSLNPEAESRGGLSPEAGAGADWKPTGILPEGHEPGTGIIPDYEPGTGFLPDSETTDPRNWEIGGNNDETQKAIWEAMDRGDFGAQAAVGGESPAEKVGDGQT